MSDRRLLITDAPRDGVYYARVDGSWSDVASALASTPLANSTYLQGYEVDGVTAVDLIGVNSSDWVEVGDPANNTQYDGALHKFSADIELHGGNDLRIYNSGGTDYINFAHDGTNVNDVPRLDRWYKPSHPGWRRSVRLRLARHRLLEVVLYYGRWQARVYAEYLVTASSKPSGLCVS